MIIVLSDLHFSEAQSTQISGQRFNRNLPPETYQAYFSEINQFAVANQVQNVDLILAGDILEISRSAIWLSGDHRPYINNQNVGSGSEVEKTILNVIHAIASEENVTETLALFRDIQNHFNMNIRLHYLLGNHDRLVNATPKIRAEVRELFGLIGETKKFDNYLIMHDELGKPFCLIRHGHEYDPANFALDVRELETIPTHIPKSVYDQAVLGDITTSEFGAALSWRFIADYGEDAIVNDKTLMAIYQRLMEFDDVRPTTAWLGYLFSTPGVKKKKTWALIKPAFTEIVNTLRDHEEFNRTLKQSAAMNEIIRILLMAVLQLGIIKKGIPYWLIKMIMKKVSGSIKLKSQIKWAKREALIQDDESGCKCVISGHSHFAEATLISAKNGDDRFYINTGTWRNVIAATKNFKDFSRLKALTKVMVFYPKEKISTELDQEWAFHFLSGVSFGPHRHL